VATAVELPIAFRRFPPQVADRALSIGPEILTTPIISAYAPKTLPRMRIWLKAIELAKDCKGPDYARWVARHWSSLGHTKDEILACTADIRDWIRAHDKRRPLDVLRTITPEQVEAIRVCTGVFPHFEAALKDPTVELLGRPFRPNMSARTVIALSDEWHEAVSKVRGKDIRFPAPWYPAESINGYDIVPLENYESLFQEGRAMHHCVATYADRMAAGVASIYSMRREGARIVTIELVQFKGKASLRDVRGYCQTNRSCLPCGDGSNVFRSLVFRRDASKVLDFDDDLPF
jgi:PcfJ-like protein